MARDKAKEGHVATAAAVLSRFWTIATADTNELIEYRRTCCRFCHGQDNRYQRTRGELERDRKAHAALVAKHAVDPKEPDPGPFDVQGGPGCAARKPPNPRREECSGEGIGRTFAKDTRTLSPAAKALYAGVKQTKDGFEVKVHDQQAALVNVAKILALFTERHEHSGPGGGPIPVDLKSLSDADLVALDTILARAALPLPPNPGTGPGGTGPA